MAPTHTLSGLLVGVATCPVAAPNLPGRIVWTVACGGSALWVDLDQRSSKASHAWGWPTQHLSDLVGAVARGHRFGTHDPILGPLAGAAVTWLLCRWAVTEWLLLALALGITIRSLTSIGVIEENRRRSRSLAIRALCALLRLRPGQLGNMVGSLVVAAVFLDRVDTTLLPIVAALGALSHIAGDSLSKQGVPKPVVWIWNRKARWRLTKYKTGSRFERWVVIPAHLAALFGVLWLYT
jgi:hypothetical protein